MLPSATNGVLRTSVTTLSLPLIALPVEVWTVKLRARLRKR